MSPDELGLHDFASAAATMALRLIQAEDEFGAVFMLRLPTGEMQIGSFEPNDDARGEQIARAVSDTDADAVVVVGEALKADPKDIPVGGRVRDASRVEDVLLVAGLDKSGTEIVLETSLSVDHEHSRSSQTVKDEAYSGLLDETREIWLLPRRITLPAGPVVLEVARGWLVSHRRGVTKISPPSGMGAVLAAVRRRTGARTLEGGEARAVVPEVIRSFFRGPSGAPDPEELLIEESRQASQLTATCSFSAALDTSEQRWDLRVIVTQEHEIVLTYTNDLRDEQNRSEGKRMIDNAVVQPPTTKPPAPRSW